MEKDRRFPFEEILAPLVPYLAVTVGLLVLHNAWYALLGYHLAMVLFLILKKDTTILNALARPRNYKIYILMSLQGAAAGVLLLLLVPHLKIVDGLAGYLGSVGISPNNWKFFLAYFVIVNPWLEEGYWRGYLGSRSNLLTVNDVLFAGYHGLVLAGKLGLLWLVAALVIMTAGAWLWRQVDRRSGSILPSILAHACADLSIMLVAFKWVF